MRAYLSPIYRCIGRIPNKFQQILAGLGNRPLDGAVRRAAGHIFGRDPIGCFVERRADNNCFRFFFH